MKSVLYARVSTEEQKNNQTIDTQIHGIGGMLQYATNHKLPVPDESMIFIDDGFSGATLIRPALTALREYLKTHDDVSYFLVYDADRIGRDTYNQLIILEELKKKNITIHFKTGELGTTPNDKLLFTILSAFSEFERAKIMERTHRGMKRRIESGKFNGGRPLFGYTYNYPLGKHELDETEAKVVKMIYDWYTEDKLNIRQIQAKLFELKIPTKYDALVDNEKNRKMKGLKKYPTGWWSEVTIRNVLANEAYTGRWHCCKNYTVKLDVANPRTGKPKARQLKRPKEEWFPIEIPRIVSDEQYKKALLQARKNLMFAKRCTKQTYLLQGLIRCSKDGLVYRGHQEKSGIIYYYCKSRMNNTPQENCHSPYVRADQIEPIVWNTVKSMLSNPEEVFTAFREESVLSEDRAKTIQGRLDYIDTAIKKLEVAKRRIVEAFKAEIMTLQEFRKEKTDLELSEEKLVNERSGLMTKLNVQYDVQAKVDLFQETCHRFLSKINDQKIMTERLKKDIIKLLIDEVVVDGEKIRILATIPFPSKIQERELIKNDIPGTFNAGATLGPVNETNMERIWNKHRNIDTTLKPKVFVGVSGGVDSSVALALLKNDGYDVTGVFLKVWHPDFLACDWKEERRSAMRVCATLGVPFLTFDCQKEYKKEVADYMIDEYREGRTPNPDIFCNKYVKFGIFLKKAIEMGADFVATGHYAQAVKTEQSQISFSPHHLGSTDKFLLKFSSSLGYPPCEASRNDAVQQDFFSDNFELYEAIDENKDQSYFLYTLNQEQLSHILFPIGHLKKPQVRKLAEKFNLPTANKKDSQGVCFLGKLDMKEFLSHYIKAEKGKVLNTKGEEVGYHNGAVFYTIGERHGFVITKKSANDPRYFVVSKDLTKNTITVANKKDESDAVFSTKEIIMKDIHFIQKKYAKMTKCEVRIRYRQEKQKCEISREKDGWHILFKKAQNGVAVGQSAVLYLGQICLGGGIISIVR